MRATPPRVSIDLTSTPQTNSITRPSILGQEVMLFAIIDNRGQSRLDTSSIPGQQQSRKSPVGGIGSQGAATGGTWIAIARDTTGTSGIDAQWKRWIASGGERLLESADHNEMGPLEHPIAPPLTLLPHKHRMSGKRDISTTKPWQKG